MLCTMGAQGHTLNIGELSIQAWKPNQTHQLCWMDLHTCRGDCKTKGSSWLFHCFPLGGWQRGQACIFKRPSMPHFDSTWGGGQKGVFPEPPTIHWRCSLLSQYSSQKFFKKDGAVVDLEGSNFSGTLCNSKIQCPAASRTLHSK